MKLLFDQNLSHKLVGRLADVYPGSEHVRSLGLQAADDLAVWQYAIDHGFIIASKDEDFHQLSFLHGPPPQVVWVRVGNSSTAAIEALLREKADEISEFHADERASFLVLGGNAT